MVLNFGGVGIDESMENRVVNNYGNYQQKQKSTNSSSALWRSLRDGDFEEADVWAVVKVEEETKVVSSYSKVVDHHHSPYHVSTNNNMPSAARIIPRTSSSSNKQQQSAPVKIPGDWSKISAKRSMKQMLAHKNNYHSDDDEYEDGIDDYKVPPHELIAERLAKSQISSFSVFEGVGRKLKGRDLSKVRNAILTKTGFLES